MSADELRQAAALMRQRAHDAMYDQASAGVTEWEAFRQDCANSIEPFAEHIASWHPTVALAVADWLEHTADDMADDNAEERELPQNLPQHRMQVGVAHMRYSVTTGGASGEIFAVNFTWTAALAVARAYLGGEQ